MPSGPFECWPQKCPYCWELYCIISGSIFLLAVPCFLQLGVLWPAVGFALAFLFASIAATAGCLKKRGKGVTVCRHGIGLIANVTCLGLCFAGLLAGAAFWFYVAISNGDVLDTTADDRYLCGISFTIAAKWSATLLVYTIANRVRSHSEIMEADGTEFEAHL